MPASSVAATQSHETNTQSKKDRLARAPADALGVKQELEKALASDEKPTQ
jgi:hypothetical protein